MPEPLRQARGRVRFIRAELTHPQAGRAAAVVTVEWAGKEFGGRAEGASGVIAELRVVADATFRALEQVLGSPDSFHLIGIKPLRVFDHDLIVVLARSETDPERQLIGVTLITVDAVRSAALAVLNATNRLMGMRLHARK